MNSRFAAIVIAMASTGPSFAATSYDGSWSMSATTRSGSCSTYTFEVGILDGRIETPPGVSVSGSGRVASNGRVAVQFTAGSNVISATGQARQGVASGTWNAPTLACSGSWSAQRR